jgi:uncharacterized protein YjbI with pentapeptide repeats
MRSGSDYSQHRFEEVRPSDDEIDSASFEDCLFVRCDLSGLRFRDCRFSDCRFQECDLSLMKPGGSTFSGCTFRACRALGINWSEASWPETRLRLPVSFTQSVLSHSTFFGLDLRDVGFIECVVRDVDFREARLSGCDFGGTDLLGSVFHEADLSGADLSGARDYAIDPRRTVLEGARFSLPEAISLLGGLGIEITD